MSTINTTYYSLTKVREQSPEAKDWAVTDSNFETLSLLLKAMEQHQHTGATSIRHPGYYDPPAAPTVVPQGTAGTTTYSYYFVARGAVHNESPTGTTVTGNATLTGGNFNRITWAAVAGATGYDVIRVTGHTTQGKIASNIGGLTFDDTGIAATEYVPVRQPSLTELTTGGMLPPASVIGVRISYVNALGLETESCRENVITLSPTAERPLSAQLVSKQANSPGLAGGTYIYAITKKKGAGETVISDVLPVEIAFDTTYSVTLSFDAINTYSDGTDGINIYRSAGFDSAFQLLTTITSTSAVQFIDTNVIAPQNTNVQPPVTSTFDASKKIRIDWSALEPHPGTAAKMRVYVSQQSGIWSTNHLLTEFDLSGTPPDFIDYLGSETLGTGWPKDTSQIPNSPPLLNLGTEATGGFNLSANGDFNGFQALDLRLENRSGAPGSPTNGMIYYDTSVPTVRAYINGGWVSWGTTAATAYTHPTEEAGGHIAANIPFVTGGVSTKSVLNFIANSTTGARKIVQFKQHNLGSTSSPSTTSTTPVVIPEMDLTTINGAYTNEEWDIIFGGHFVIPTIGTVLSVGIEYDGSLIEATIRAHTASVSNHNVSFHIEHIAVATVGVSKQCRALWWVNQGSATAQGVRRYIKTRNVF